MITVLCGTGFRHYDGFLFRRAAPRRTSASSIAPFSEMQPITRPRNITRPDGAGSDCAELTVASAQDDPALSTHLMLRSRVIDRIPTPDGTAPSRRPSARMRQHPPRLSTIRVLELVSRSAWLHRPQMPKQKKKMKVRFALQGSRLWDTRTYTWA